MNYFKPAFDSRRVNRISMLGLAHIGDAVYEMMTRASLCEKGYSAVQELHKHTTARVKASAQAAAAAKILPLLDEEEASVFRRGRNTHVNSIPHAASVGEYHAATALEALFGWLYLQGMLDRLNELFAVIDCETQEAGK